MKCLSLKRCLWLIAKIVCSMSPFSWARKGLNSSGIPITLTIKREQIEAKSSTLPTLLRECSKPLKSSLCKIEMSLKEWWRILNADGLNYAKKKKRHVNNPERRSRVINKTSGLEKFWSRGFKKISSLWSWAWSLSFLWYLLILGSTKIPPSISLFQIIFSSLTPSMIPPKG